MDFFSEQLDEITTPFEWKGKQYVLTEAGEAAAVKYRNDSVKAAVYNPQGKVVGVNNHADIDPQLVANCLFQADAEGVIVVKNDKRQGVTLQFVLSLPARIVDKMAAWVKQVSHLEDESEAALEKKIARLQEKLAKVKQAKNSGGPTPTTSATAESTE